MKIILASNSPRRRELLMGLGIKFEVKVLPNISEEYPKNLPTMDIAEYIACLKAKAYKESIEENELIITADTIVILGNQVLGKPKNENQAKYMLQSISGKKHKVVTGVCITTNTLQRHFSVSTDVTFKVLKESEINYYIHKYKPFDKAGAYGIQEWIGYVGVTSINGSYFNVMGLPVQRLWEKLCEII